MAPLRGHAIGVKRRRPFHRHGGAPRLIAFLLGLLLVGCAGRTSTPTTDGPMAADVKACASIRAALAARDPGSLAVLDILCMNQLVVVAGALPPDYTPAVEAVHIARKTPGVTRVETFFVARRPQESSDPGLAARIKAALPGANAAQTDLTVVAGTVVLVGVVDDQAMVDRIVADAGAVAGVKGVKSFIELKSR